MNKNTFHGILFSGVGSLWWGIIGVLYFKSVAFVGPIELILHRTVWTAFLLLFTVSIYSKYYLKNEVESLLTRSGFKNIQIVNRHGYSWTAIAEKI